MVIFLVVKLKVVAKRKSGTLPNIYTLQMFGKHATSLLRSI